MSGSIRAFVSVSVGADIIPALTGLQKQLQRTITDRAVRWVSPQQFHITLKFFGEVPAVRLAELKERLLNTAREAVAFELGVQSLGCFPGTNNPRVLWAGITGEVAALLALQQRIAKETVGFRETEEETPFAPHVTLARIKTANRWTTQQINETLPGQSKEALGSWRVTEIELMQSVLNVQGATYSRLAEFPLEQR